MRKIPIRQLSQEQIHPIAERFKIRRLAEVLDEQDLTHDLHRHTFFFILAISHGDGSHEIDFMPYPVTGHTIFFLRPGQVHQLFLKANTQGYLLEFNPEFYNPKETFASQRLRRASHKNFCALETDRFNKLQAVLESMLDEYTEREDGYREMIRSYLDIFCLEYGRQSSKPQEASVTTTYAQERLEDFTELLDKHISRYKQVSDYVSLLNLSPYQLNEITKTTLGRTASAMINEHIILEAKRYLLATTNQVKEVAEILGYEDVSYFIRFFKKHTGFSPDAFRHR